MWPFPSWVAFDYQGTGMPTNFHRTQRDLLGFREGAFAAILLVLDLSDFDVVLPKRFGADAFWCSSVDGISSPLSTSSIAYCPRRRHGTILCAKSIVLTIATGRPRRLTW
jgi:hypothetical protein